MNIDLSGIRSAIEQQVPRRVPGLSVVAGSSRGVAVEEGFGAVDIEAGSPMDGATISNWFSMTKLVTATSAVQLADEGLLDLDAPAMEHYELIKELRPFDQANQITVRHLLSHSSGITNPLPLRWVHPADEVGPKPAEFVEGQLRKHRKLRFNPGQKAAYTNLGYLVVGEIVANVSGQSFEDRVRTKILDPLQMSRTGFSVRSQDGQWATPYHPIAGIGSRIARRFIPKPTIGPKHDGFLSLKHFYVDGPAYGGLIGPANDAIRFALASLNDGELEGTRIISTDGARDMRKIISRGRSIEVGLGWFRRKKDIGNTTFVEHLGGGAGFWNCLRIYPDQDCAVVVMGNSTSYDHQAIVEAGREAVVRSLKSSD